MCLDSKTMQAVIQEKPGEFTRVFSNNAQGDVYLGYNSTFHSYPKHNHEAKGHIFENTAEFTLCCQQ